MPQRLSQSVQVEFNKGLLTEHSELNFPKNASVDELNCNLSKAGNRSRRLGVAYEDEYELTAETYNQDTLFHTAVWPNVGKEADVEFLVVQAGATLRFFRKGNDALSTNVVPVSDSDSSPYILDMSSFNRLGGLGAQASRVDVASINGYLVVVSPQIEPFYIERNETDGSFTAIKINFRVRDFKWLGDREGYDEVVPDPLLERKYDTLNVGWDVPPSSEDQPLPGFIERAGGWPPLTHPWFSGRDEDRDFRTAEFLKIYGGSSIISNGHYILSLFEKDRTAASGLPGIPKEELRERFSTAAAYAGRVWFAGADSNVYYSQILENISSIGDCFQQNDPTSEYFNDLLPTDGGYIRIPEAHNIKKLHVLGASILVFADNGVWRISGRDGNIFDNADFSVYKVTDFGLAYRGSFVSSQNAIPLWWSYTGIHTIEVTQDGGFREVNISRDTIQSFWNNLGAVARGYVVGAYDAVLNKILWIYPDADETVGYKLNNILFLDIDLGAFYPWRISDQTENTSYVVGTSFFNGSGSQDVEFNVVDSDGELLVDEAGEEVVVVRTLGNLLSSTIYLLTRDGSTGSLTFSRFSSTDFLDWGEADYSSYLESAYSFITDLGRRKNSPYITTFMKETETGFSLTEGVYEAVRASSLKVSSYWDFKKNPSSAPQEAYRHKSTVMVDEDNLSEFLSPTTVLTTRLKMLGRGRVIKLRFESTTGKDFNLLGWETLDATNPTY